MKISELKEPYLSLAYQRVKERVKQYPNSASEYTRLSTGMLISAFTWCGTPEGSSFWHDVDQGKTPPLPECSKHIPSTDNFDIWN